MVAALLAKKTGVGGCDTQPILLALPQPEVKKQSLEISAKNHYFFLLQNPPTTPQLLSRVTVVAHIGYHTSIDDVMSPY